MALYALVATGSGKEFTTQFSASSAQEAVRSFFAHPMAASISPALATEDILYVTPMEGLVNTWAACAGKEGRYVSITVVQVHEVPNE
jgi:hypothetical protein